VRSFAKRLFTIAARILVFPAACLAGFGRWHELYLFFAHTLAIVPGIVGSYLRVAYYRFTLDRAGPDCHMAFGSYFAHSSSSLGARVGIGSYCVLGQVDIGQGTLLASHVQVLSGSRQHMRDDVGNLTDEGRRFRRISIGPQCWIGAGAIIMADVGAKANVAPGSVVSQDVPQGASISGNPARNFSLVINPLS
jgi:virginiamycin A acetyltransferase